VTTDASACDARGGERARADRSRARGGDRARAMDDALSSSSSY